MGARKRVPAALVAAGAAVGLAAAPAALAHRADAFEVTITNSTSGQPLTPPVVATHRGRNEVFRVGSKASFELKEIAENGNNGPLLADLGSDADVSQVLEGPGGPLVPAGKPGSAMFDDSTKFTIATDGGARRISFASMLICTNDGFTGVNSLRLPRRVGQSVSADTMGYDAGTEANTEDLRDIVPPCQGLIGVTGGPGTGVSDPALAQNDVIRHHGGITGRRDLLPAVHGWDVNAPVAQITVKAMG